MPVAERVGSRTARVGRLGTLALVASATWAWPGLAQASGIDVPHIGTTWSSPTTRDAAALYWNPAMLAYSERGEVLIGVGVAAGNIRYQRDRRATYQLEDSLEFAEPIDPAYIDPNKTGSYPEVASPFAAPNGGVFAAIPLLEDRLTLGLGVYVPYAAPLEYPEDGAQRFALQQAFIAVTRVSAGLAVKVHERVSLGASVSYVLGIAQLRKVQDFAAVDLFGDALANPPINQPNDFGADAPSTVRELSVLARPFALHDGLSHGVTFNVSIAANPIDPLWIGLTYDHGSRTRFRGSFQLDMDDQFFGQDLSAKGLDFPPLVEGDATLGFRLPKRILFGLAYDISSRLRVDTNLAYVFWSDLKTFELTLDSADLAQPEIGIGPTTTVQLPRNWKGAIHADVSLRGVVGKRERVKLSGTVGYQSPASPDETVDVASPDGQRLLGAFGVGFVASEKVTLYADTEIQGILPRTVTDSDFDLGNGTYNLLLASVMLHAQVAFGGPGKPRKQRTPATAPSPEPQPE